MFITLERLSTIPIGGYTQNILQLRIYFNFRYDQVLEFGLPDWRQPVYYYRKVKKLGILEALGLVFVFLTVADLIFMWVTYFEKQFNIVSMFPCLFHVCCSCPRFWAIRKEEVFQRVDVRSTSLLFGREKYITHGERKNPGVATLMMSMTQSCKKYYNLLHDPDCWTCCRSRYWCVIVGVMWCIVFQIYAHKFNG